MKHGPTEAYGNAHQLCLYNHVPLTQFWAAVECMNFPSSFPKDIGTVGFTRQCAETVGVDWWGSGVGKCVEGKKRMGKVKKDKETQAEEKEGYYVGKEGRKLLLENIRETEKTGVTTSCTIEIGSTLVPEGKRTCVVDGGVWKGCDVSSLFPFCHLRSFYISASFGDICIEARVSANTFCLRMDIQLRTSSESSTRNGRTSRKAPLPLMRLS